MYFEPAFLKTQKCLLICLVLVIAGCGVIEKKILYRPKSSKRFWDAPTTCETRGLEFQDVSFCSEDGVRLHGWFVAPAKTTPKHYVLFSHGRSGNISSFKRQLLKFVRTHQIAVFAYDYRGYGKSQGEPSEQGLYLDADAASDWLCDRVNLEPSEIIVMGRSLGGAVAIDLASRDGANALIVESSFTSFPDIFREKSRGLLSGKRLTAEFDSRSKIGSYQGPILISHGFRDRLIPFHHGVELAEATTSDKAEFIKLPGGHRTPRSREYAKQLEGFLSSLPNQDRITR